MGKKLFIGNLSFSISSDSLKKAFEQCGTVDSSAVILDRESGRSKGFGFVEMATDEEAQKAISRFNGVALEGRVMTVNEAKPMVPRDRVALTRGHHRS